MAHEPAPVVVAPEGEIDLHASPMVKDQIEPLIAQQRPKVIVDLAAVSYIDSSGLAVLIEAMQRIQAYGGKFGLCGLRDNVRHIFNIARLDQIFPIYTDQSAALATI
jgi:anti-sigma B factor antagonist